MRSLQYLAMITDFKVERRTVTIDVSLVEGVGSAELPGSQGVDSLKHGIEGVMLG
jgi:hypothetical protein